MSAKGYCYLVLSGHLLTQVVDGAIQWRFAQDAEEQGGKEEVHPISHGDMLKVFDEEDTLVWSGIIAYNYEMLSSPDPDRPGETIQKINDKVVAGIQPSARPVQWLSWFEKQHRARLEIRITEQHALFSEVAAADSEEPEDREALRERIIHDVLSAHDKGGVGKPVKADPERKKAWWED